MLFVLLILIQFVFVFYRAVLLYSLPLLRAYLGYRSCRTERISRD